MSKFNTRIQNKYDTLSNWNNSDFNLLSGEIAVATNSDYTRVKIGDGTKSFSEIADTFIPDTGVSAIVSSKVDKAIDKTFDMSIDGDFTEMVLLMAKMMGINVILPFSPDDWFTWTDDGTNATVTGLQGSGTTTSKISIPRSHNDMPVITIGSNAFKGNTAIDDVGGSGCRTIGDYAFQNCTRLTTALFPECITIGNYAFDNCTYVTNISFPKCTSLSSYAFYRCSSLTDASFQYCITIGANAFNSCSNLETAYFPNCKTINMYGFRDCNSLTDVSFNACESIGAYAFQNCSALTKVSFQECLSVENNAFQSCTSLTNVYLPKCKSIKQYAFTGCSNLTKVYIPYAESIGAGAFTSCSSLIEVDISQKTMSQVKAMANFPWSIPNSNCKIICKDGWIDKNGTEHRAELVSITYNLTGIGTTNQAESVMSDTPYSTTLYFMNPAWMLDTLTVMMNGTNVTNTVLSGMEINIPLVTGPIIVSATAIPARTIGEVDPDGNGITIDTTNLPSGTYNLQYLDANGEPLPNIDYITTFTK